MKVYKKYVNTFLFYSIFVIVAHNSCFAATIAREAAESGYEKGRLQESEAVKRLESQQQQENALRMPEEAAEAYFDDSLDSYGDTPIQTVADPLEPWNRFWFGFNDISYLYVFRPLYRAYDYVVPDDVQSGLTNFLNNLMFPVRFVNSLLQGKFSAAGVEFGRFMINTTVGMAGFIDVAKHKKTVVPVDPTGEDFGQTLGTWGFGEGFYLVLPLLGPSSLRDLVGIAGDYALSPTFYFNSPFIYNDIDMYTSWAISGAGGVLRFNDLGPVLDLYEDTTKLSVDPYVATREAYTGYRRSVITR